MNDVGFSLAYLSRLSLNNFKLSYTASGALRYGFHDCGFLDFLYFPSSVFPGFCIFTRFFPYSIIPRFRTLRVPIFRIPCLYFPSIFCNLYFQVFAFCVPAFLYAFLYSVLLYVFCVMVSYAFLYSAFRVCIIRTMVSASRTTT